MYKPTSLGFISFQHQIYRVFFFTSMKAIRWLICFESFEIRKLKDKDPDSIVPLRTLALAKYWSRKSIPTVHFFGIREV